MKLSCLVTVLTLVFGSQSLYAASAPKVGKRAASRYFQGEYSQNQTTQEEADQKKIKRAGDTESNIDTLAPNEHYLTFGFSQHLNSEAYKWGNLKTESGVAKWGLDMTYRISQYSNLVDQALRVSYNEYEPDSSKASKLSVMYAVTLPDAGSKFPLYFGAAVGPGFFLKQLPEESPLSVDYQLYLGLRLFNVVEKTGFYVEGGLRNHLQLTSDGQVNGSYVAGGAVWTF